MDGMVSGEASSRLFLAEKVAAIFRGAHVLFATEQEYRTSVHLRIGKQISVPRPGISAMPDYVRLPVEQATPDRDLDIHTLAASEGRRRLVLHLQRERSQTVVRKKKTLAISLDCEVHHLLPLSDVEDVTTTRMDDLAILCANCHRVVHLQNPPYTLQQVKNMLGKSRGSGGDVQRALLQSTALRYAV